MSVLIPSDFCSYSMTEEEALQGAILTNAQKHCVQNHIALYAAEKLELSFDPEHPMLFMQREAELKGQINSMRFLLDMSLAAEEAIRTLNNAEVDRDY